MNAESENSAALERMLRALLPLAVVLCLGCSEGGETATVSGKANIDGQPLTTGKVIAVNEVGQTAEGKIESDGTFVLKSNRNGSGVIPGSYRVAVVAYESGGDAVASPEQPRKLLIPARYTQATTSGLGFEVAAGQSKELTLELTTMN